MDPAVELHGRAWTGFSMMRQEEREADRVIIACAFLIAAAVLSVVLCRALFPLLGTPSVQDHPAVLPHYAHQFSPEPLERLTFFVASAVTGTLAFLLALIWPRGTETAGGLTGRGHGAVPLLMAGLAVLVLTGFSRFDFGPSLLYGPARLSAAILPVLALLWLTAAALLLMLARSPQTVATRRRNRQGNAAALVLFFLCMALQITSWRLPAEASVEASNPWSLHWDAVVYSISQVAAGRTILHDLPAQYGFSPEIIGRLFRLTPFSVLKLSLLFALLQVIGLCAVFRVLRRETSHPLLQAAFAVALILITFETVLKINGMEEFYFQYWPLRFFWPALSLAAFHAYAGRSSLQRAAPVSLCGVAGSFWNSDSGLAVTGAFGLFLAAKWVMLTLRHRSTTTAERRHLMLALVLHAGLHLAALAAAYAYFVTAGSAPPHWEWLTKYQQLFFGQGFFMLPMPAGLTTPWLSVLGVYLLGMTAALFHWRRSALSRRADLLFFLSALGWGLFIYYQGRSHILNLITVAWPALVSGTLLASWTLRLVQARRLGKAHLLLPATMLALLGYCALPFLQASPALLRDAMEKFRSRGEPVSPLVAEELAFIRSHTSPGQSCAILTQRQGLYHAIAQVPSPVTGPGYVELVTITDQDEMLRQVEEGRYGCVILGLGPDTAMKLARDPAEVLGAYEITAVSPSGTLQLFTSR
jgi:hypothetical protein